MKKSTENEVLPYSVLELEGDVPVVAFYYCFGTYERIYIRPGFIRSESITTETCASDGKKISYATKISMADGAIEHSVEILP